MTDDYIENLKIICQSRNKKKVSFHDYYSIGRCIKEYARFPKNMHLPAYTDHSPAIQVTLGRHDNQNKYRLSLLQNTLRINAFTEQGKRVYCTGAPFVHYRKKRKKEIKENASGTVFFPYHSTAFTEVENDIEQLVQQIDKLPKEFKPVTICLHHCDVENDKYINYLEKGFNVVSAGNKFDIKFVDRFYEILSNHKYSMSNGFGSHLLYSIEFGLPFSYIKNDFNIKRTGNPNLKTKNNTNSKTKNDYEGLEHYELSKKLFSKLSYKIDEKQKAFAEDILGIHDAISPIKLNKILWREYFIYQWYTLKHTIRTLLKPRKKHAS